MAGNFGLIPPMKGPLQLDHIRLNHLHVFATRKEAEAAALELGLCRYRAPISATTSLHSRVWVLRNSGKWWHETQELLTLTGQWAPIPTNPYAPAYRCPLMGGPEEWLRRVRDDYPSGSLTRLLADAAFRVLLTSKDARKRRRLLRREDVEAAMAPELKTLARMWDMAGAETGETLTVVGGEVGGPTRVLADLLLMAQALGARHPNGVLDIVEFERWAADLMCEPEPKEDL